ncbi:curlin [Rhodobacterales bacterium HKCCE3408]|nr:curlin [Rhodobacterales bacterium HKCCE3408]
MFRKALLAIPFALATLPAMAGGTVSVSFEAGNAEEAQAVQTGLALYQIVEGVESGAYVHQDGSLNAAALLQAGSGSTGVIHQEGDGHSATLNQQGNNQAHGIFQFGEGADADVVQTADGAAGITLQFGWD